MKLIFMSVDFDNPPAIDNPVLTVFFYGISGPYGKREIMGQVIMTLVEPPWKSWPQWFTKYKFVEIINEPS